MKARIAAVVCLVLVAAAAVVWWTARDERESRGAARAGTATRDEPGPSQPPAVEPSPTGPSSGRSGKPISRCAPSRPTGEIPRRFWGMHVSSPIGEDFPGAPIAAVNLTTSQVYWSNVETEPGVYDFSRLDDIVSTSESRRAKPMLVLGFTPLFHAEARESMPKEAAWRAWVTAVVERYGDRLDYQVWPEPSTPGNWNGTPEQMARLAVIAGTIIHDRAPDAVVVAPATTLRLASNRRWMDRFWGAEIGDAQAADAVDVVALDPYPAEEGTPEDALDLVCEAERVLRKHRVDLPVWINELNYGVPSGDGVTEVQHYPDEQQVAFVARTYLLQAAQGMGRVYWLGWGSYPRMTVELERDGRTTPAGEAFSVVHRWLAGGPRPVCRVKEGLHTCVVPNRKDTLRIHWRVRGTSVIAAGDGATRVETIGDRSGVVEARDRIRVEQTPVAVFGAAR